jgi:hypothetical protein
MNDQNTPKLPTWQEFHNELIVKALKDENFRGELIADPKAVVEKEIGKIKEGMKLPTTLEIKVIEQPANAIYLVLPTVTDELSDEALDGVAGGKKSVEEFFWGDDSARAGGNSGQAIPFSKGVA